MAVMGRELAIGIVALSLFSFFQHSVDAHGKGRRVVFVVSTCQDSQSLSDDLSDVAVRRIHQSI